MKNEKTINSLVQIAIPVLTIGAQIAIAFKFPLWFLLVSLSAQPFWFYSAWKSYRQAGQSGVLVNTIIFTIVTIFGIVNYLVL